MKVKEREAWVSKNVGKGGKRPSYDEFNKSFKGCERNPRAKEYASQGIKGYHHYNERAEVVYEEDDDDKKPEEKKRNQSTSNIVKNIVSKFAAAIAGTAVLVATYTTMTVVDSQNWLWSDDMQSVSVELVRSDGNILRELPATITITQDDPTCNQTGLKTYTATAEDEDETIYTDVRYETLSPLGHKHFVASETSENGHVTIVYECSRCHEQFIVTMDIDEND